MQHAIDPPPRTKVRLEFGKSLSKHLAKGKDRSELEQYLRRSLEELLADLQIPTPFQLSLAPASSSLKPPGPDYRLRINGRKCRLLVPDQGADAPTPKDLAHAIAWDLFANRELLVTRPLSQSLRAQWRAKDKSSPFAKLDEERFHDRLQESVRRCVRFGRLSERVTDPVAGKDHHGRACLERAIAQAVSLKVLYPTWPANSASTSGGALPAVEQILNAGREQVFKNTGVILPPIHVEEDASLDRDVCRLRVNDLRTPPLAIERVVRGDLDQPVIASLITTDLIQFSLALLRDDNPSVVDTVRARFDLVLLTRIVRNLAEEAVSVADLRTILEALLTLAGTTTVDPNEFIIFCPHAAEMSPMAVGTDSKELRPRDYTDCIRLSLAPQLSWQFKQEYNTLSVYLLTREMEHRVQASQQKPLSEAEHDRLVEAIWRGINAPKKQRFRPVLLTSFEIRRTLRRLIEREFPALGVLCYQELPSDLNINPLGRISWKD